MPPPVPPTAPFDVAAHQFRESMVSRADGTLHAGPVWYGWALVEAFAAGRECPMLPTLPGEIPESDLFRLMKENALGRNQEELRQYADVKSPAAHPVMAALIVEIFRLRLQPKGSH